MLIYNGIHFILGDKRFDISNQDLIRDMESILKFEELLSS
jgi:hypothetical protein